MQVVETTTPPGLILTANPEDTILPRNLQSHLAHPSRYASPANKTFTYPAEAWRTP